MVVTIKELLDLLGVSILAIFLVITISFIVCFIGLVIMITNYGAAILMIYLLLLSGGFI